MRLWSTITLAIVTLITLIGGAAIGGYGLQIKDTATNATSISSTVKSYAFEETKNGYEIYPTVEYEIGDTTYEAAAPSFAATEIPYKEEGGPYKLDVFYSDANPDVLVDGTGDQAQIWFFVSAGLFGLGLILAVVGIVKSVRKFRRR